MTYLAPTTFTVEILSTTHAWVRKHVAISLAYKQSNCFLFIEVSSSSQVRASTDCGTPQCSESYNDIMLMINAASLLQVAMYMYIRIKVPVLYMYPFQLLNLFSIIAVATSTPSPTGTACIIIYTHTLCVARFVQ